MRNWLILELGAEPQQLPRLSVSSVSVNGKRSTTGLAAFAWGKLKPVENTQQLHQRRIRVELCLD